MKDFSLLYVIAAGAGLAALHFKLVKFEPRTSKYLTLACWLIILLFAFAMIINGIVDLIAVTR